jgi:hypothetical protein
MVKHDSGATPVNCNFRKTLANVAVSGAAAFAIGSVWAEPLAATPQPIVATADTPADTAVGTTFGPEDPRAPKGTLMALAGVVVFPKAGGALLQTHSASWKLEHLDPIEFHGDDNEPVHILGIVVAPSDADHAPTLEVQSLFADVAFPMLSGQ